MEIFDVTATFKFSGNEYCITLCRKHSAQWMRPYKADPAWDVAEIINEDNSARCCVCSGENLLTAGWKVKSNEDI